MTTTILEWPHSAKPHPTGNRLRHRRLFVLKDCLLVIPIVTFVMVVQGTNIVGFPVVDDDEGTYLTQAWAVQHLGQLAPYTYWYDHPPLGWIQLAGVSWLPALLFPNELAVAYARPVMLAVSAASVLLMYVVARRLSFNRAFAALAMLLFALSPLSVALHRQIYLDNFAVAWMLAAFALALSPRRHLWHHTAAGACAGIAILSKETILLVLPALLMALWQGSHESNRKFSYVGFSCSLVFIGAFYILFAVLKGELLPGAGHVSLVDAIAFQLANRSGSGSILNNGSAANTVLVSWLSYDWILILAATCAVIPALFLRNVRTPAVAVIILMAVALRPNGYLPRMYIIQALPFLALIVAGLVAAGTKVLLSQWSNRSAPSRAMRMAAVVACAAVALFIVVPNWYEGNRHAMSAQANDGYSAAAAWIKSNVMVKADSRILVDNGLWLDMVNAGFRPGDGAIWFYKLDLDPAVHLPNGWKDLDYVVSTAVMRSATDNLPTVDQAIQNSTILAQFDEGPDRVEVRQIVEPTAS